MAQQLVLIIATLLPTLSGAASAVAQLSCTDTQCTSDCNNNQWNVNECYNSSGGNSMIFLTCDSTGVNTIVYTGTGCQGQGSSSTMDVATCLSDETNTSFINTCVDSVGISGAGQKALAFTTRHLEAFSPAASAVAQLSCTDTQCTNDCSNTQWNINECYNTTGGNSQIFLSCDSTGVSGIDYTGTDCQGQGSSGHMDVAKCLTSETSTSFINTCVTGLVLDTGNHHGGASSKIMRKSRSAVVV
jgi:hypothetical protein